MSFANAANAVQFIDDFGTRIADLARRVVTAGASIKNVADTMPAALRQLEELAGRVASVSQNARGTLYENVRLANEAIAKAAKDAEALRAMFPLDIDPMFKDGMSPKEQLDALKKYQESGFGGPKPSDIQGTPAQTAANMGNVPPGFERSPTGGLLPTSVLGDISSGFPTGSAANMQPGEWRELGTGGFSAAGGRAGLFGDTYTPGQLNQRGRRFDPVGGGGNAFAAQLGDFAALIEFTYGPDNFFAHTIRSQIPFLTSGAKSPAEVRLFLEAAFTPFIAGIQRELQDPTATSQMQGVAGDMLRLIAGGNVGGGGNFPTINLGPRPPIPPTTITPRTSTAGIDAARTTAGVSSDTRGVSGGVTGPGAERTVAAAVTSLHSAVSSANEEWRRQFNELRGQFLTQGGNIHELGQHFDARAHEMLSGIGDLRGLGAAQQQKVLDQLRLVQSDVRNPAQQQKVLDRLKLVQDDFRERIDPRHLFQPVIDGYLRPLRENMFSPRDLNAALRTLLATQRLPS